MKLYTKGGDEGLTSLADGRRVAKNHPRIVAGGAVDELNSHLGWALAEAGRAGLGRIVELFAPVQGDLFALGTRLSCGVVAPASAKLSANAIAHLEGEIDAISEMLPPLGRFILPGGCELAGRLHICRSVCRRVESAVAALADSGDEPAPDVETTQYINRLSDLLFAAARLANHETGQDEPTWPA